MTRHWRPAKLSKSSIRGSKTDFRTSSWKSYCRWPPKPHSQRREEKPLRETARVPMSKDQCEKQCGFPRAKEKNARFHSDSAGSGDAQGEISQHNQGRRENPDHG